MKEKTELFEQVKHDFLPHQQKIIIEEIAKLISSEPTHIQQSRIKLTTDFKQNKWIAVLYFDGQIFGRFRNVISRDKSGIHFGCEFVSKENNLQNGN